MKNMTMIEVVKELQKQGHDVEYYVRKDGGILVRKIDGTKFPTGASGNTMARQIVGADISSARVQQLKYATRAKKTLRAMKTKNIEIEDKIKAEWQRVKRKWNKAFKAKEGKPHPAGYFGWSRIKYTMEHYGKEEALRRIVEAEKYASGIAYEKNVKELAIQVKLAGDKFNSKELADLYDLILENAYAIREEWIRPAYDALYKLNAGVSPKQVANDVRAILRLK